MRRKNKELPRAVAAAVKRALVAINGDSNDEEHDALLALIEAISPGCPAPPQIPEKYRVRWEIDSDADTLESAACEALVAMRAATMLPVFEVTDREGNRVEIDLDKLDGQKSA